MISISMMILVLIASLAGCSDKPPTAAISYQVGCVGDLEKPSLRPVDFTAKAEDPEHKPLSYQWDFGNGSSSKESFLTHLYKGPGEYDVTLTVSDGKNQTKASPVHISIPPEVPYCANLSLAIECAEKNVGTCLNYLKNKHPEVYRGLQDQFLSPLEQIVERILQAPEQNLAANIMTLVKILVIGPRIDLPACFCCSRSGLSGKMRWWDSAMIGRIPKLSEMESLGEAIEKDPVRVQQAFDSWSKDDPDSWAEFKKALAGHQQACNVLRGCLTYLIPPNFPSCTWERPPEMAEAFSQVVQSILRRWLEEATRRP